jgi:RNA polymerase subunit RPABC4/transcription elongation factor Spt4
MVDFALALPLLAHAAMDEQSLLAQDTHEKVIASQQQLANLAQSNSEMTQRLSNIEYSINSVSSKSQTESIITAVFTALLCAFLTYWFVARILVNVLREINSTTMQAPATLNRPDPVMTVAAPDAFDLVKESYCKKCDSILADGTKYCPADGAKASIRSVKVPIRVIDAQRPQVSGATETFGLVGKANNQAVVLENRVRRTPFQKFVRHLIGA